ncbi:DUF4157 domain-containing protein [Sulfitobacter mediterraneus]|uniref:eCIS core domain-containing protein n=1 Tax=Sulfitobacter mediterraneus TaxID=83219 RepID=UPI000EA1677D|nr:DUF4157 domain-containing protein [Sulfitobacter mediterraneus]
MAPNDKDAHKIAHNTSGLPDTLRLGMEALSGIDLSSVQVHRNSHSPAKIGASAFTRGTDIHIGPGQDRHLPHEAWHVVQQKQGRVRPSLAADSGAASGSDAQRIEVRAQMAAKKTESSDAG